MVNTHWEKRRIQIDEDAWVSKKVGGYKSVSRGGGSYGIITVSKEFIGKKFKVILIPEVKNNGEESVQREPVLSSQN